MPFNHKLLRPKTAAASGPPPFSPTSISNLMVWLDPSDASTITLNGTTVSQWQDKSGAGRHCTQATASAQPTYNTLPQNGLATIRFVNGKWMSGTAVTSTSYSVFVVIRPTSSSGSNARYFTFAPATGSDVGIYIPLIRKNGDSAAWSFSNPNFYASRSMTLSQWSVLSSVHSGSAVENRVNGGTAETASFSITSNAFTRYAFGYKFEPGTLEHIDGDVAECVVYTRNLTASERASVEQYLGTKWGITVT